MDLKRRTVRGHVTRARLHFSGFWLPLKISTEVIYLKLYYLEFYFMPSPSAEIEYSDPFSTNWLLNTCVRL